MYNCCTKLRVYIRVPDEMHWYTWWDLITAGWGGIELALFLFISAVYGRKKLSIKELLVNGDIPAFICTLFLIDH